MNLFWANIFDCIGNGYGYSMHARMLREACEREGSMHSKDAQIAIHIITPDRFHPVPRKINVLYSMYECTTLPKDWKDPLQLPDLLIVPCRQNKDFFANYTQVPIEICWEGVDVEIYKYVERKMPVAPEAFVFLWVGAPNPRKGFQHVAGAWDIWHQSRKAPQNVWLYMKTSGLKRGGFLERHAPSRTIVDTRDLPLNLMFDLYSGSHAFVLPSMGEGFGLTLAEAMSTGLPCIYTPWGGPRDFCSEREGFPVKWKFKPVQTVKIGQNDTWAIGDNTFAASADPKDIIHRMEQIYFAYDSALERGRRAAARIRAGFTWDHSASSFLSILERRFGREARVA
jgi:glycosyltransferase involved in cell wall biosynthesis